MLFLLLLKGIIHESTLAAIISKASGAVDQILFTEGNQFSCFLEVLSFKWSGSTERPARTTLTWEKWQRVLRRKCTKRKQKRQRRVGRRGRSGRKRRRENKSKIKAKIKKKNERVKEKNKGKRQKKKKREKTNWEEERRRRRWLWWWEMEEDDKNIPWFFTGVTYPLVLQSTVSGRVTPLGGRKWDPSRSVSFEKWARSPRKKKRYSSTVRSPNWFIARVHECPSELCCWIFWK